LRTSLPSSAPTAVRFMYLLVFFYATTVIHPQCNSDGWGVVDENHSDIGVTCPNNYVSTTILAQRTQ